MKSELQVAVGIVSILAIVVFLVNAGSTLGFSSDFTDDIITVLPGVFVFIVGALMIMNMSGVFYIPGFGMLGIGVAILLDEMNTAGVIVPELLTGSVTLEQAQVFIVIICLLIGAVVASTTWRRYG